MNSAVTVILSIALLAAALFTARQTVHMFQLNSYQYQAQWRYFRTHMGRNLLLLCGAVPAAMCCMGLLFWGKLLAVVWLAAVCAAYFPREAKKKLVYTARVKRLFVTTLLLAAVITAAALLVGQSERVSWCVLLAGAACMPLLVLLANLVNRPVELGINRWYVEDAKKLLRSCPDLKIIGITGSYGKTSVKYYLHTLLSARYDVLMTPESYNTPMGVVKTIRGSLRATHEIFLCEMGARHVGDIKEVCDIVDPGMGVITSLGYQHLETFHSLENVVSTKKELFDALPEGGPRFINGDNEFARSFGVTEGAVTYGLMEDNAYRACDLQYSEKGSRFTVKAPDGSSAEFATRLIGEHNVVNITGAIAVAHELGIPLEKLKLPVSRLEGVPHRLQPVGRGKLTIIDDAYNSNPNGTKMALKTLALFDGVKVLVTPGMVELGSEEDRYNFEFGVDAAAVCDYIVLVGKKQTESLQKGVCSTAFDRNNLYVAQDLQDGLDFVYNIVTERKLIVLLENDLPDNY